MYKHTSPHLSYAGAPAFIQNIRKFKSPEEQLFSITDEAATTKENDDSGYEDDEGDDIIKSINSLLD